MNMVEHMDLHPALGARLDAFLTTKFNKLLWEGAELEYAMLLHQTRMKDVCESIKAHDHWLCFREHFPEFDLYCRNCGGFISPEFDRGRHMGRCCK